MVCFFYSSVHVFLKPFSLPFRVIRESEKMNFVREESNGCVKNGRLLFEPLKQKKKGFSNFILLFSAAQRLALMSFSPSLA